MKGKELRKILITSAIALLNILAGCGTDSKEKVLLTVDFQQDKAIRYEFISSRTMHVNWGDTSKENRPIRERAPEYTEFMQVVMAYKPVEVNLYGLSVIEATCERAYVNRTKRAGRESSKTDAVTTLEGKTFRFAVGPNGEIEDYADMEKTVRQAGEKAFRPRSNVGIVKEPDMLGDFIETQWFLWDAISSVKNPAKGVAVGQSWESQTSLPVPMVMKAARNVKYTLAEIKPGEKGNLAVIKSEYSLAGTISRNWPLPYPDGAFQMSGPFGFFRDYKMLEFQGQGEELFNIDAGQVEKYHQKYSLKVEAGMPMGMNIKSQIYIEQDIIMTLMEDGKPNR